jgi:hypothetical protein
MSRLVAALLLIILAFGVLSCASTAKGPCMKYEPARVTLTGEIKEKTYPGPPEYTSVAKGDTPETYWFLHLRTPVCVDADSSSELNTEAESGVSSLQLVMPDDNAYERWNAFRGHEVTVTGSLYSRHTGHHHTKVLLTVVDMQRPGK